MKTKISVVALVIVALCIGIAIQAARRIERARLERATLARHRIETANKINELERHLQSHKAAVAKVSSAAGDMQQSAGTVIGTNAADKSKAPVGSSHWRTVIANDPQKISEHVRNYRLELDWSYGWILKALKLSPERIGEFKDLEISIEVAKMDLQAAIDQQGIKPGSPEHKKLWAAYDESCIAKKAAFFGDQAGRFFDYDRSRDVRYKVHTLAWTGIFTGEPATSSQINQAAEILLANCQRKSTDAYPGKVQLETVNWSVAREQLKRVLSPTQIETIGIFVLSDLANAQEKEQAARLTAHFKAQIPPK